MDFIDFLNKYWTVLFGIASFVFALGYTYFGFKQMDKDRIADREYLELQMREQKKDHDERIIGLEKALSSTITKVDALKDDMFKAIGMIQLDIREIMTILKNKKRK